MSQNPRLNQLSNPDMPEIIFQSSMLSSVFPKKNPMAHSCGLFNDAASPAAATLFDCKTQEPTGRTQKVRPG
jgi:hypothetical protein